MTVNGGKTWEQLAMKLDNLTEHQYIRKHILEYGGVADQEKIDYQSESDLIHRQTEEVFSLCRNRLVMGRFRYGSNLTTNHFNCIPAIQRKLKLYIDTGNMEALIDLINYTYLEYRFGTNPKKHFSATDDEDHASGEHKW